MKRPLLLALLLLAATGLCAQSNPKRPVMDLDKQTYLDLDASGIEPADTFWGRIVDFRLPNLECKYDISIGHLGLTMGNGVTGGDYNNRLSGSPATAYKEAHTTRGPNINTLLPYVTFTVKHSPRIEWGLSTTASFTRSNTYNIITREVVKTHKDSDFLLSPTVRWNMVYSKYIRLYLMTGMDFVVTKRPTSIDAEASPFVGCGTTLGARVYLLSECRASGVFYCGYFGIGYRF